MYLFYPALCHYMFILMFLIIHFNLIIIIYLNQIFL